MPKLPIDLEIDRLLNLIHGFGWKMEKKDVTDTDITVTIKKEITEE